jgi:predicted HicB family RNase H-like nuclease
MPPIARKLRARTGTRTKHLNGHRSNVSKKVMHITEFKDLVGHDDQEYMVLRTLYLKPDLDQRLRILAQRQRKSKNQLIREFLARCVMEQAAMRA